MASFSDYLDPDAGEETAIVVPKVTERQPGIDPEPSHEELSGPHPDMVEGAQFVHLFETVEGRKEIADPRPSRQELEDRIRQLRPADIRNEILLGQQEAAKVLGVTAATLKAWRERKINLPYYIHPAVGMYHNRRIAYRVSDLIRYREWVMQRISPMNGVHLPAPGMMGTPLTPGGPATPPDWTETT